MEKDGRRISRKTKVGAEEGQEVGERDRSGWGGGKVDRGRRQTRRTRVKGGREKARV